MGTNPTAGAPDGGYLTDYNHDGHPRRAVKFTSGSISFYTHYDVLVEGTTHQGPSQIHGDNVILLPEEEDIAWNSRIEIFGANGADASKRVFEQGEAIRPFAGKVDDSEANTRIVFEEGNVTRYDNYSVVVSGQEVPGIVILAEQNAIKLPAKVPSGEEMVASGLNASGRKIPVFKRVGEAADTKPSRGFVIFHGTTSTCIMFAEGDMTRFSPGYKLVYENDQSTTVYIGLAPNHIRYESVGKNIVTELRLYALDGNGAQTHLLFQGRYNGDAGI